MKQKISKNRADEHLLANNQAESRSQAQALILAGKVRLGTERIDKPGKLIPEDAELTVVAPPPYVSRGGEKLAGFLEQFKVDPSGWHIIDVGASTGGFTDCLLQRGAESSTCIDVGHGQLHMKLRSDPRVTNLEKVNARALSAEILPRPLYNMAVMDLSFISLTKVLPAVWPFIEPGGILVCLVKPQFEVSREEASRGRGIIKDPDRQQAVLEEIKQFALENLPDSTLIGHCPSPIRGADGNQEFLLGLKKS